MFRSIHDFIPVDEGLDIRHCPTYRFGPAKSDSFLERPSPLDLYLARIPWTKESPLCPRVQLGVDSSLRLIWTERKQSVTSNGKQHMRGNIFVGSIAFEIS